MAYQILPNVTALDLIRGESGGAGRNPCADMRIGALVSLTTIYIVLAWVFANYTRPLVVMSIIPFAVVGAVFGNWLLGFSASRLRLNNSEPDRLAWAIRDRC